MAQEPLKDLQATAMDSYFDFLHKTISSCPTGGTQLGEKLKDYSEKNIAAARDYMRKMSQARISRRSREFKPISCSLSSVRLASKLKVLAKRTPRQQPMRSISRSKKSPSWATAL